MDKMWLKVCLHIWNWCLYRKITWSITICRNKWKSCFQFDEILDWNQLHDFHGQFFSSLYLFVTLPRNGMAATGIVTQNEKHLPKNLKAYKEMEKSEVLAFQANDSELNFIKWKDTRAVYVWSHHVSTFDSIFTERKQKVTSEKKRVSIPVMVKTYNQHMGGADLADQMRRTYAIDLHFRYTYPYYLRLFFDVLDTAVVDTYSIYNELDVSDGKKLDLFQFWRQLVYGLVGSFSSRKWSHLFGNIRKRS